MPKRKNKLINKKKKSTWSRDKLHPSDQTQARLTRATPSETESEGSEQEFCETPVTGKGKEIPSQETAAKAGKVPDSAFEEMKDFIKLNSEGLLKEVKQIKEEVFKKMQDLTTSVAKAEKDVKEIKTEMNKLANQVDQHQQQLTDYELNFDQHEKRLIFLEDQNRRANIRVKYFPETQGENLRVIMLNWFKELIPDFQITEMEIDRIHRVTANRSRATPRDILVKFANYYKKEQFMKKLRSITMLKFQGATVEIYNDLCQQTIIWRRSVKPLIAMLKREGIVYSWGYPVFLRFMKDGRQQKVTSLQQGLELLRSLGIADEELSAQGEEGGEESPGTSGK